MEYDCDIFISKVNEYPKRTEPTKMGEWKLYTFQEYLFRTKRGELTPSHLKFYDQILGKIYVHNMELKVEGDEIAWQDREVAYVGELASDYPPPQYEFGPKDRYEGYRGRPEHTFGFNLAQPRYQPYYPPSYHNPVTYQEVYEYYNGRVGRWTGY